MRRVAAVLPIETAERPHCLYRLGLRRIRARGGWRRDWNTLMLYDGHDRETLFRYRSGWVERVWDDGADPPSLAHRGDYFVYYEEVPDPPEAAEDAVEYPANPWATASREVLDKR